MALVRGLLDLLYPPLCILCGGATGGPALCERCGRELPRLRGPLCTVCGKPVPSCVCTQWPWSFATVTSVFSYRDGVRRCLVRIKGEKDSRAAEFLGAEMARSLGERYPDRDFALVTPVPMNPRRMRERGFNHAALLARTVAGELGLPMEEGLLLRLDGSQTQHQLDAAHRGENARQSYRAAPGRTLTGQQVLLVDDIMTTGATLHWCARQLREMGAGAVYCLTAATAESSRGHR